MRSSSCGGLVPLTLLALSGCALFFDDQAGGGGAGGGGTSTSVGTTSTGGAGSTGTETGSTTTSGPGGGGGGGTPTCEGTEATWGFVRDDTTGLWVRTYAHAEILDVEHYGTSLYVVGRAQADVPCGVPYLSGAQPGEERFFLGVFVDGNVNEEMGDLEDILDLGPAGDDVALSHGADNNPPVVVWSRGGQICMDRVSDLLEPDVDLTDGDCGAAPLLDCATTSGAARDLSLALTSPRLLTFHATSAGDLVCSAPAFDMPHEEGTVGVARSDNSIQLRSFGVGLDRVEVAAVDGFDARIVGRCASDGNVLGSDCGSERYFHLRQTVQTEVTPVSQAIDPANGTSLGLPTHGIHASSVGWAHTTSLTDQRRFTWRRELDAIGPTPLTFDEPDELAPLAARIFAVAEGPSPTPTEQILAGTAGDTITGALFCQDRCAFWLRVGDTPTGRVVLDVPKENPALPCEPEAWAVRGAWDGGRAVMAGAYRCGALTPVTEVMLPDFAAYRAEDDTPAAFVGRLAFEVIP